MYNFFKRSDPSLAELETENRQLKRKIETLQRKNEELTESNNKLRRLVNVQERLTVAEQVNAATQRRQLLQEHAYENLPPDSVYQQLRFDPTQQPIYETIHPTTFRGWITLFLLATVKDSL